MKVTWKTELPQLVILALMLASGWLLWDQLPEKVPMHWNLEGEVDRLGGRFEALFVIPLTTLGLYLLLLFLPRIDPGRMNYPKFSVVYLVIRYAMLIFFAVFHTTIVLNGLGYNIAVDSVAWLLSGALMLVLGSVMNRIKPNWFVGIRTPWTLSSKLSWEKTHRVGGRILLLIGAAMILAGVIHTGWATLTMLGILPVGVIWMVVYSYWVWRGDPDRVPPAGDGNVNSAGDGEEKPTAA